MAHHLWKLGVVSYLNARPLIEGLVGRENLELRYDVPARLTGLLLGGEVDAAMMPVIDYLRYRRKLAMISDACIGADGATMTVRVYSTVEPESVRVLRVDGESRTSVVLAQVLWRGRYGCGPSVVQHEPGRALEDGEALLLIGDKVASAPRAGFACDLDLGRLWKEWTGLPFVFAAWMARRGKPLGGLTELLSRARDEGVARVEQIARWRAAEHGWSEAAACQYLTEHIKYTLGPRFAEGMNRFFELALGMGLVERARAAV